METLLIIAIVILAYIAIKVDGIAGRLKEKFPTEKEQDHKWAMKDPIGHWEAHKNDKDLR